MKTLEEKTSLEQIRRITQEWSAKAKNPMNIEVVESGIYAFGSELACLRLYYKFRYSNPDSVKVEYSTNKKSWFFVLYK